MRETLEVMRTTLGAKHPSTLTCMSNLALLLQKLGKLDEAEVLLSAAVEGKRAALGPQHPSTRNNIQCLAALRQQRMQGGRR